MHQAPGPLTLIIVVAIIAAAVTALVRANKASGGGWSVFTWIGLGLAMFVALVVIMLIRGYATLQAPAVAHRQDSGTTRSSKPKSSSSRRSKSPEAMRSFLPPEPEDGAVAKIPVRAADEPGKLSVPPLDHDDHAHDDRDNHDHAHEPSPASSAAVPGIANKPRPAWVDLPGEVRPDGTIVVTIKGQRTKSISSSMNMLAAQRHNVTQQQITQTLNRHGQRASIYYLHRWMPQTIEQMGGSVQREVYQEWDNSKNVAVFARLEFTPQWEQKVLQFAHQAILNQRMFFVGAFGTFALGLLGIGYGYLRFNAATDGQYRWRLRLAALASVLTLGVIFAIVCDVTRMDDDVLFPWL